MLAKIKQCVLDGMNLKQIAKECGVSESTLYGYHSDNYLNLADKIRMWKMEYRLNLAERRSDEIMKLPIHDADNVVDGNVLRAVQKEAVFLRKTLDKETYTERQEMTGAKGQPLFMPSEVMTKYGVTPDTKASGEGHEQV